MAVVEFPWAYFDFDNNVPQQPSIMPTGESWVARPGQRLLRLQTVASVPAGRVSFEFAYPEGSAGSGGYVYFGVFGPSGTLYDGTTDPGGGTLIAGYTAVAIMAGSAPITPSWAHPGGPIGMIVGCQTLTGPPVRVSYTGPRVTVAGSAPVGASSLWSQVESASTTAKAPARTWHALYSMGVSGIQGPWQTSDASGSTLVMSADVGPTASTVTIPVQADGTSVTVRLAGTPTPTLVSAGGGIDNGDGTVTVNAGNRRNIVWSGCSGRVKLTMAKGTATGVISYSPFYLNTPPLPPTPPTITKLIPTSGPDTGGTLVDIIGTDLTGATGVDFGGTAGTGLTVDPSGNLATVTTPAHTAGPAPVTITTPAGTSAAETFTFEAPLPPGTPTLTGIDPASGPETGGTPVLLTGTTLAGTIGVDFGGSTATIITTTDTALLVTTPAHTAGTMDVTATDGATTTDPLAFEYAAAPDQTGMLRRTATIERLLSLLRAANTDPNVSIDWAGRQPDYANGAILVGRIRSDTAGPPTIKTRPLVLDDKWKVDLVAIGVEAGGHDPEGADSCTARAEALASTVVALISSNPTLKDASGQPACSPSITVSDIDGPEHGPMPTSSPGLMSWLTVTLTIHQRLEVPQ